MIASRKSCDRVRAMSRSPNFDLWLIYTSCAYDSNVKNSKRCCRIAVALVTKFYTILFNGVESQLRRCRSDYIIGREKLCEIHSENEIWAASTSPLSNHSNFQQESIPPLIQRRRTSFWPNLFRTQSTQSIDFNLFCWTIKTETAKKNGTKFEF